MQAIRSCVRATVRGDLKEPVAPVERSHEERVTFRWRRFLLLTYLVVTASTAQLCLMTQDEIRERKLREAQETRNRLRSTNQEQQVAGEKRNTATRNPSQHGYQRPSIEIWIRPNDHQREVGQCGFRIVRTLSNRERFARMETWSG